MSSNLSDNLLTLQNNIIHNNVGNKISVITIPIIIFLYKLIRLRRNCSSDISLGSGDYLFLIFCLQYKREYIRAQFPFFYKIFLDKFNICLLNPYLFSPDFMLKYVRLN